MRKHVWLLIVLAAVAIATIYTGVWYATATFVREQTVQWLQARRAQGLGITYAAPSLTGFPLKAEVLLTDFYVAAPGTAEATGWTWRTPALRVYARPFVFDRFFVDLAGAHRLTRITAEETAAQVEQALAAFTLGPNGITRADVVLTKATTPHGALEKADASFVVKESGLHVDLSTTRMNLPDVLPPRLGRTVEDLKVTLDITGTIGAGAPLPEVLEAWRVGGGTVEVRDFHMNWPPLSGMGSGTITLDSALQPEGAFSGTFQGFMEVVDMLVAGGRMDNREASMARGALMLLATTPHEGAPPELKVAVTVQGRKVYAGPVTLMDLPPLTWRKDILLP